MGGIIETGQLVNARKCMSEMAEYPLLCHCMCSYVMIIITLHHVTNTTLTLAVFRNAKMHALTSSPTQIKFVSICDLHGHERHGNTATSAVDVHFHVY